MFSEVRAGSWLCLLVALGFGAFGIWCARAGIIDWNDRRGYDRFENVVLVIFGGGSLLVAAVALVLARDQLVFWLGICVLLLCLLATTFPRHRRASVDVYQDDSCAVHARLDAVVSAAAREGRAVPQVVLPAL